jgi:hypothetical protein
MRLSQLRLERHHLGPLCRLALERARAVTFFNASLPTNGRHWKSQSFPPTNPNSMSQGRGAPEGSFAGSIISFARRPAATRSVSSPGSSTWSRPVDATIALEPPGCSMRRHGDLNDGHEVDVPGRQSSVSAGVPSTAPADAFRRRDQHLRRSPVSGSPGDQARPTSPTGPTRGSRPTAAPRAGRR